MNKIIPFDPFADFRELQRQFFGDDWFTPLKSSVTVPTTDVYTDEDKKELVVEAHLPNFTEDDVDVHMENGSLVIQAQKHERTEDKGKKYVVRESSSSFYRRIQLPERANTDNIQANLEEGMLKVVVPLRELPKPKKIAISSKSKVK
jgi:HSP20 family protein